MLPGQAPRAPSTGATSRLSSRAQDRTSASALFVSLSAVGMAAGPLLALPLSRMPTLRFAGLTFDHVRPNFRVWVF